MVSQHNLCLIMCWCVFVKVVKASFRTSLFFTAKQPWIHPGPPIALAHVDTFQVDYYSESVRPGSNVPIRNTTIIAVCLYSEFKNEWNTWSIALIPSGSLNGLVHLFET